MRQSSIVVVIVNYRTAAFVGRCLESLLGERAPGRDISAIVVDGASPDDSVPCLQRLVAEPRFCDWVDLVPLPINGGFGWANNQAMLRLMQGAHPPRFIHVLNPDTLVEPGAVTALADFLEEHGEVAAVGSQIVEPAGRLASSAFRFPTVSSEFARGAVTGALNRLLRIPSIALPVSAAPVAADWVTGASVMFRTSALRDAGLFDDGFFLYHEEVELMWRLRRAGWGIWTDPRSRVVHIGGAATGLGQSPDHGVLPKRPDYWYESRRRLFCRMYGQPMAALAVLAWGAGHCVWSARRILGLAGNHRPVEREFRDQLRIGLTLGARDRRSSVPRWTDSPGTAPAWMGRSP